MPAHEYINQNQLRALKASYTMFNEAGEELIGKTVGEMSWEDVAPSRSGYIEGLRNDIKAHGIIEPLHVGLSEGILHHGHHRAMIAKELGLSTIPVTENE